jgi:hypothetical protein
MEGTQQRVLDVDKTRARDRANLAAAPMGWAFAPDRDQIVAAGFAQRQLKPGQLENAPDLFLGEKAAVEIEKPRMILGVMRGF